MTSRWILFIFAILVGAGLGLLYGWVINPVDYVDTTPDTLRIDYKTDYVLMDTPGQLELLSSVKQANI